MRLRKRLVSVDRELPQPRIRADYDAAGFFYLGTPIIEFRGFGSEPHQACQNESNEYASHFRSPRFYFFGVSCCEC
jgi:hypothetical protein